MTPALGLRLTNVQCQWYENVGKSFGTTDRAGVCDCAS